ncbi:deoxyribodipyrimidine photo-lyase [Halobacteriales archaeon SW_7_68_16]|nr:MAG: deoxyribodipyrimidine photo-lyase [Halobacteriales archaeon SW_7_68_16]
MQIHWHRNDLRVTDNRGLAAAADAGDVVPAFVFDDEILEHGSPPRVAYMLDALESLRAAYRDRGSDLLIRRGRAVEEIPRVAEAYDADRVVWNADYSGLARRRDEAVAEALAEAGVDHEQFHDAVHHEPGSITTNAGDPYSVFTYYGRKWRDRPKADPYDPPAAEDCVSLSGESLPTLADLGFDEPEADVEPAGTDHARERLRAFCSDDIDRYDEGRDYPAEEVPSRLSAHLKWGTIGVRTVHAATETAMADAETEAERESVAEFQSQLAWREFYTQVLYHNPEVVTENYTEYEEPIEWRNDPDALRAWKDGETGYPIVDAGMRQLRREAYMHNRVRMIVASFLTKDLLVDWREGYDWFRRKLADHETGNDNGGWQWAASTGTDAQPYFRIFNPMTQGERYDPDAEYITSYVPELRDVPSDRIHSWHELTKSQRKATAPEYPAPIVDHSERREQALAMFKRARGEDPDE